MVQAGDDEDVLGNHYHLSDETDSDSAEELLKGKQGAEEALLLDVLSGNDVLCARLLYEWADAVYFVFDHFSSDDLSDHSWKLFFRDLMRVLKERFRVFSLC